MKEQTDFEKGMALVEQGVTLLRKSFASQEASIRQAIIASIAAGSQPVPKAAPPAGEVTRDSRGRVAKGTSEIVAMRLFTENPNGMTWAQFEELSNQQPEGVSFAAVKKAAYRLLTAKTVKRYRNKLVLTDKNAAGHTAAQ